MRPRLSPWVARNGGLRCATWRFPYGTGAHAIALAGLAVCSLVACFLA
ncbi:hypothetical protein P6F34_gp07 [Pseudomonas phage MiCath]|uniref:Uncharacterized protein n=1 Tax=Pseudomonas phage MiCath TaxID=3003729 RepID=A0AAF0AEY6_9CAUD|nr:hypothetical protein P6F34_gp07 [Pseudomonas phage MiCath]WAX22361.1 hypothetical protein [Pseudomonas phage MiCath]